MKHFLYIGAILAILLAATTTQAASASIEAVDANGDPVDTFLRDEVVYITGRCVEAADKNANVYVVHDRGSWKDGISLTDVSGTPEFMAFDADGRIDIEDIWRPTLAVGEYDIVIDTNRDGEYNDEADCVAGSGGEAFQVIDKGFGRVRGGSKNPDEDIRWDFERDKPYVTLLQVRLTADDLEDLKDLVFRLVPGGSANEQKNLVEVLIAEDRGNDGIYVPGHDIVWGSGVYKHDNSNLIIDTNTTLEKDTTKNVLVVYVLGKELISKKTFSVQLERVESRGVLSGEKITFDGTPIESENLIFNRSGDAQPVTTTTVTDNDNNQNSGNSGNTDTVSDSNSLSNFFSRNNNEQNTSLTNGEAWVPPISARVALFLAFSILVLMVCWRFVRAIIAAIFNLFS